MIQGRAVQRGMARKPPLVLRLMGVGEKAVGHGQQYMTIGYNIEQGPFEWVGEDRKKESLDGFFLALTLEQKTNIEAVGLDMWAPFISSIPEHVPRATGKMVFDPVHIVKHMNDAVNDVRKWEHRLLAVDGKRLLSGTRFQWLYGQENLPGRYRERVRHQGGST